MKSSAVCYTFCGATFDEEHKMSTVASPSASEASTTCHCHFSSPIRDGFDDEHGVFSLPTSRSTTAPCDLCERLRGRTGGRFDLVNSTRTEDGLTTNGFRSLRRKHENFMSASDAIVEKRDRTSRCERVPLYESSARCASSVVRWNFAIRFWDRWTITELERKFLWIVFLILVISSDLASAQDRRSYNTIGSNATTR
ncbi:uncharacterized protein LOC109859920, partial [Pseudomyrmex gracilis]|uniref:uncharacterized protein LOC109859920 n=1 Tax=Pseudomyrmex gracilis TaxID=219809 RepID=UPI000995BE2A